MTKGSASATLDPVEDAIGAIRAGQLVIVVDDADRENEGDLIMAAAMATPAQVAFMIRHTSGILCTPLTADDAARLRLTPMVAHNDAPMGTAFTVSIDYRYGLSTGISAEERTNTVRALANPNAGADDFVRPGHIFPLIGKEGGVLVRSGHTEAAIDLARLAGLAPVGLLAELVNDDGTVKRLPELLDFAREHRLSDHQRRRSHRAIASAASSWSSGSASSTSRPRPVRPAPLRIARRSTTSSTWRWCSARCRAAPTCRCGSTARR